MPLTILCGAALVMGFFAGIPSLHLGDSKVWYFAALFFGSVFALRQTARAIADRELDVNVLMVVAAVGAIMVGHPDDAAILLFLFSLSSSLESMAERKTESAIGALVKLQPSKAIRVSATGDETIPVEDLRVGDTARVLPFEPIPADGLLLSESGSIDESTMTGESRPAALAKGDQVIAGTQNLDQMILIEIKSEVKESSLAKVIALVQEAQDNKASGERISAWFGARYTYFVVAAFVLSLAVRLGLFHQPWNEAFYNSLILLVALSPCALVISSPAAALSALAYAARRGILVRGGQFLEDAGRITMFATDKTGTLTTGRPAVVEVCVSEVPQLAAVLAEVAPENPANCGIVCWHHGDQLQPEARRILRLAACIEQFSTHPIADSIVSYARELGLDVTEPATQSVVSGMGAEGVVEGQRVKVGQFKYFDHLDEMPSEFAHHVEEMRERGLTAVLVNAEGEWAAIALQDRPRTISKKLIESLSKIGIKRVAMLTGDNVSTAQSVGQELGISEIYAGLLPGEKHALIQKWSSEKERVLMVGDGVNDAPSLSSASLGVAMGGLGSEVALRAADVVLIQDRIDRLPELIVLGRKTNQIIMFNVFFAAAVIVALTIGSFFGKVPLPLAVIGHEGSTAVVVLNGLRLLWGPSRATLKLLA